jgi:catechol 2,3-dioxygenase-like lactoylglutathione lyase family enzyme
MKFVTVLLVVYALVAPAHWTQEMPSLPKVLGFSHVAVKASNVEDSVAFYRDFLGFSEQGRLRNLPPKNDTLQLVFMKVNEDQWLEIFDAVHLNPAADRLYQIALRVVDAEVMRCRLAAFGAKTPRGTALPPVVSRAQMKNLNFSVLDPHGYHIESVQYMPEGRTLLDHGRYLSDARIPTGIIAACAAAGDSVESLHFYRDILGFRISARIPAHDGRPERIRMSLQDSSDVIELVLADRTNPHVAFAVPDLERARERLERSAYLPIYGKKVEITMNQDGQRCIQLDDPMGVEIELREIKAH